MRRRKLERRKIAIHNSVTSNSVISHFFFSSRRRHTRSKRDWSSDVCSSDLKRSTTQNIVIGGAAGAVPVLVGWAAVTGGIRSEERRVGKECRSRRLPYQLKKKKKIVDRNITR